jgi:hypothetical protein
MDSCNAASTPTDPDAVEFVRFCYRRRRVGWPELYDEMCAVAGRGLFRGYTADDLAGLGIGFSLFDMPALSVLSGRIVAEEQALRRPAAVMIAREAPRLETVAAATLASTPASIPASPDLTPTPGHPVRDDRTFDVPIRLAMVSSVA